MGWLIRYTGPDDDIVVPGRSDPEPLTRGQILDVTPGTEVRTAVTKAGEPWERIGPGHPDYIAPGDR